MPTFASFYDDCSKRNAGRCAKQARRRAEKWAALKAAFAAARS